MRKVCVVTGTRSEYGLLYPILKKIEASHVLTLQLIATTMHLSHEFGLTYEQIEADGFTIAEKIENLLVSDTQTAMAKSSALATLMLSESFQRLQPDVVVLLGDRYETLAAATTALLMNIPIAHIHGGEVTQGAVDEQIRHAITKMSYWHFCATRESVRRIAQMGEASERIFCCGAPGLDVIRTTNLLESKVLERDLNWSFGTSSVLFTYHSETLRQQDLHDDMRRIFRVLEASDLHVLFTYANSDAGGGTINRMIEAFCRSNPTKYKVVKNLGQHRYLSVMQHVDFIMGNSSSGIIEAASFHKPVVNIGSRQKGRLQSGNVINCEIETLERAIDEARLEAFKQTCQTLTNCYGRGNAAACIVDILEKGTPGIVKKFIDRKSER